MLLCAPDEVDGDIYTARNYSFTILFVVHSFSSPVKSFPSEHFFTIILGSEITVVETMRLWYIKECCMIVTCPAVSLNNFV
jgi:hypothetical protein